VRERMGQILKLVCFALAAVLLYQLVQTARRVNPLSKVVIPALPRLASDTNALATGAPASSPARSSTNVPGTNAPVKAVKEMGSNLVAGVGEKPGTNSAKPLTPALSPSEGEREKTAARASAAGVTSNVIHGTNATYMAHATNHTGTNAQSKINTTNAAPAKPAMPAMSMPPPMMRGGGSPKTDLPPEIKARVDRIYESELFGMVMRPQPMALQGIMGNSAILRTPSGQTGLVKEGDSLGEIKLLRIGINRVLVEQDGKKSELTIFEGFGGESLMPKDKENSK
jgi:hypothetical protein